MPEPMTISILCGSVVLLAPVLILAGTRRVPLKLGDAVDAVVNPGQQRPASPRLPATPVPSTGGCRGWLDNVLQRCRGMCTVPWLCKADR